MIRVMWREAGGWTVYDFKSQKKAMELYKEMEGYKKRKGFNVRKLGIFIKLDKEK